MISIEIRSSRASSRSGFDALDFRFLAMSHPFACRAALCLLFACIIKNDMAGVKEPHRITALNSVSRDAHRGAESRGRDLTWRRSPGQVDAAACESADSPRRPP